MNWLYLAFTFFLIMDPVGNISSVMKLIKDYPRKQQIGIITREMLIVLGLMLAFNFIGDYLLSALDVSEVSARLASGLVIFLGALKILFPTVDSPRANLPKGEPYIVPIAIPLVCGPALMGTVMLFARIVPTVTPMLAAIFAAVGVSALILYFAPTINRWLGSNGLVACEKLMGMVLVLLGIQRFMDGVKMFLAQ